MNAGSIFLVHFDRQHDGQHTLLDDVVKVVSENDNSNKFAKLTNVIDAIEELGPGE